MNILMQVNEFCELDFRAGMCPFEQLLGGEESFLYLAFLYLAQQMTWKHCGRSESLLF